MRANKSLSLTFVVVVFSTAVIFSAQNQLMKSIWVSGLEVSLNRFSSLDGEEITIESTKYVMDSIIDSHFLDGYDYEIIANAYSWLDYWRNSTKNISLSENYYNFSSQFRPTWPNSYVELAKIARTQNDYLKLKQNLKFAVKFGPYYPASKLLSIDVVFSDWVNQTNSKKIAASQSLLKFAQTWKHRSALNQMIQYSSGKQRICNLLKFNRLSVEACK